MFGLMTVVSWKSECNRKSWGRVISSRKFKSFNHVQRRKQIDTYTVSIQQQYNKQDEEDYQIYGLSKWNESQHRERTTNADYYS